MRTSGRIGRLSVPLRVVAQRFAFLLLTAASIALLLLGRAGYPPLDRVQVAVLDLASPILDVLSRPVAAVNQVMDEVTAFANLYQENQQLREENERLRGWQARALTLAQENAAFRGLLRVQPEPGVTYVSGRVIGDSGGPFVRAMVLNAGTEDGVRPSAAVVTGRGLVGRVVGAGRRASRVLLLTDLNSRVPVIVESSRYRAILVGDNTRTPSLGFLPGIEDVRIGDRIETSGHGGVFPAGLPVGVVSEVNAGTALVSPYVRFDRLEHVRVLVFDFPTLDPELDSLTDRIALPAGG